MERTKHAKGRTDGRELAVQLLEKMERENTGRFGDDGKSRELLYRGLADYCGLPARQKQRFLAVLNDYIGSAMQGGVTDVCQYRKGRPETQAIRSNRLVLRDVGSI